MLGGISMEQFNLDMMNNKKITFISSEEALHDVIPFIEVETEERNSDVQSGRHNSSEELQP